VHPVGFIIRIYHDSRSPERQKQNAQSNIHNRLNKTPQEILRMKSLPIEQPTANSFRRTPHNNSISFYQFESV